MCWPWNLVLLSFCQLTNPKQFSWLPVQQKLSCLLLMNIYLRLKIYLETLVRVLQIAIRGEGGGGEGVNSPVGESEILLGVGNFFTMWREPEEEWFWQFEPFSKPKTAFCEDWKSVKIKIKMAQEQWLQLKLFFLLGYNLKIVIY